MLIAQQKRHENIAEYLLYMWQVEDLLRVYNLDINRIDDEIINRFDAQPELRTEIHDWYEGLIMMMKAENKTHTGHLQICKNVLIRLADLHAQLLNDDRFPEYRADFYRTLPYIVELRAKAGTQPAGELETCFNALYGVMLLRMKGKEISTETQNAIAQIAHFIGLLAQYFKRDEEQPLFATDLQDNSNI